MINTLKAGKRYFEDIAAGRDNLIKPEELHKLLEYSEDVFLLYIRRKEYLKRLYV